MNEAEEDTVGSEFIHLRLEGSPSVNIISVYLEPGNSGDCAKKTHKTLEDKVQKCVNKGEECLIMEDMNAAINDNTNSSKKIHPRLGKNRQHLHTKPKK